VALVVGTQVVERGTVGREKAAKEEGMAAAALAEGRGVEVVAAARDWEMEALEM